MEKDHMSYATFDGLPYDHAIDGPRLHKQLDAVKRVMRKGRWLTLPQIASAADCMVQSASARVRDLRKEKFGGYEVERKALGGGVFQYRIATKKG